MLSRKPPMGFNTWNTFGKNISDSVIRETADKMVELGLKDAGYEYLVIDDCWSEKERDPETGKIVPDRNKFPNGMKAVADYVHSKGLKFGMYSCAGARTCADYPGSFDHEFLDAETFAEIGCDFLKYDYCNRPMSADGEILYRKMGMALKACGREILFSACNWGHDNVCTWARSAGVHMYRTTGDINDTFTRMRDIAMSQVENLPYSSVGCFNDIDMLTCGMYGKGNVGRNTTLTKEEYDRDYKVEFALWCMFSTPLMIGCDIRTMNDTTLKLLTNKNLLRINQDEEARPAFPTSIHNKMAPTFVKHLSNNEFAVLFTNLGEEPYDSCCLYFNEIGIPAHSGYGLRLTDVFTGEDIGVKKEYMKFELDPHECRMFIGKLEK